MPLYAHICICVYVCVRVCVRARAHALTRKRQHIHKYTNIQTNTSLDTYTHKQNSTSNTTYTKIDYIIRIFLKTFHSDKCVKHERQVWFGLVGFMAYQPL